jgi:hypothetical protein
MKSEPTKKKSKHGRGRGATPRIAKKAPGVAEVAEGSLIDRRVGQGQKNLRAALQRRRTIPVDTSAPGTSVTDRKAGGGATAARNTKARTTRATAMLEDSARTRPSRKSTRRSANRTKQGTALTQKAQQSSFKPSTRASRGTSRR